MVYFNLIHSLGNLDDEADSAVATALPDIFTRDEAGDESFRIFRMGTDGSGVTNLTPGEALDRDEPQLPRLRPTLAVIDTSDSGADLAFDSTPGASYRVSRAGADGAFAVIGETTNPSFADSGLTPQTAYRWHVTIVQSGVEGATSADVTATTRATPPVCDKPGTCPVAAAN